MPGWSAPRRHPGLLAGHRTLGESIRLDVSIGVVLSNAPTSFFAGAGFVYRF